MSKNKNSVTPELIEKLENEFYELATKIEKLDSALSKGESFAKQVGEEQYNLLVDQIEAMITYRNILSVRIMLLKKKLGGN